MKYVVVVGGSMSGIGKGTLMSSIGVLLRSCNISCTAIKIDPYLNVDAGTISPHEHGEVYVLEDGGEADLDLGNYERFLNLQLSWEHSLTSGKVFRRLFDNERAGKYLGKTVQMVPHVVDAVLEWIIEQAKKSVDRSGWRDPEICLVEIGGTVGDIESEIYVEAMRQLKMRVGPENICICHLSYVPCIGSNREQKSKPTQASVKAMSQRGLQPDLIFCRCEVELEDHVREKVALFTQVKKENVISVHNTNDVYSVPLILEKQRVAQAILGHLHFEPKQDAPMPHIYRLDTWRRLTSFNDKDPVVVVGLVGKYTKTPDAYLSVINALKHSTIECGYRLQIKWIDSALATSEEDVANLLKGIDGVVVPGGFGDRAMNGKVATAAYCLKHKVPYLGICLGFQVLVLAAALKINPNAVHGEDVKDANEENIVVGVMPEYQGDDAKGATMRVGARSIILTPNSLIYKLYDGAAEIRERHRHRFQADHGYVERLYDHGLRATGISKNSNRITVVEFDKQVHPFCLGTQFHGEYKSTPYRPSPPFLGFILASKGALEQRLDKNNQLLLSGNKYHVQ